MTDSLIRLGLCSRRGAEFGLLGKEHKDLVFQLADKEMVKITQLGYEFVTTCRQPPKKGYGSSITRYKSFPLASSKFCLGRISFIPITINEGHERRDIGK